jgi:uncharacterized repeat protein (TIGR03803 family)
MRIKDLSIGLAVALAIFARSTVMTGTVAIAQEKALHNFNLQDGVNPAACVIFDAAGNLYGITSSGGSHNYGIVFELSPKAGGGWGEKVLHNFNNNGKDGFDPVGLTFDNAGNLWGTTYGGGVYSRGTVFELTPQAGGNWVEKIAHNFGKGMDGSTPYAGLIFDAVGKFYGTTVAGGVYGVGTVFELSPRAGGGWGEKVLYNFRSNGTDGNGPLASLVFDASGNLYGTTFSGGTSDGGTAFELTPAARGEWTEQVLHSFGNSTDGINPIGALVLDAAGNLYGAANWGGTNGDGMVFELSLVAGNWEETVVHEFGGADGASPEYTALVFDAAGNLYGTTASGGTSTNCSEGCGTVFELMPASGGSWTESVLHSFDGSDGSTPYFNLTFDAGGNLYGVTFDGGVYGNGTVFEIKH